MGKLTGTDLRDPAPPLPGAAERAAVAARAGQLRRRRRSAQGAGALGVVAAVAVGVAALTAGGTTSAPGVRHIEAANAAPGPARMTLPLNTAAPVVTEPAPATTVAPPAAETQPADQAPAPVVAPAAPATVTVSGHVSGVPAGALLTLQLAGTGGTFSTVADAAGNFSIAGIPVGVYTGTWSWESSDHTAAGVGKLGGINLVANQVINFSL
jgi:hypothetical protein